MVLLETVDEMFSSFGSSCKRAIYFHLRDTFKIKKQEIPLRIEDFANALEQLLGDGAKFIELRIIAELHKKTPNFVYTPPRGDLVFAEYLANLRHFLLSRNCKGNTEPNIPRKQTALQLLQRKPYRVFS